MFTWELGVTRPPPTPLALPTTNNPRATATTKRPDLAVALTRTESAIRTKAPVVVFPVAVPGCVRGKGADLTPPFVTSLASPHRPKASDGAFGAPRREYI